MFRYTCVASTYAQILLCLYQSPYDGVNRCADMLVQEGRHELLEMIIPLLQYLVGLSPQEPALC